MDILDKRELAALKTLLKNLLKGKLRHERVKGIDAFCKTVQVAGCISYFFYDNGYGNEYGRTLDDQKFNPDGN
jgi:hypothetical protein